MIIVITLCLTPAVVLKAQPFINDMAYPLEDKRYHSVTAATVPGDRYFHTNTIDNGANDTSVNESKGAGFNQTTNPGDLLPRLNLSVYAEDFDVEFPFYENSGYSGFSSTLTADYTYRFSSVLSGQLSLDFSISADVYSLSTTEAWLGLEIPNIASQWDISVGTQNKFDSRGWFYDATLDMIYTRFTSDQWGWQFGAGRESLYHPFESGSQYPLYWISELTHHWNATNYLAVIATGRHDDSYGADNLKSDLRWFGAQSVGMVWENQFNRIDYWAQVGLLSGSEAYINDEVSESTAAVVSTKHRGWAVDAGVTLLTSIPGNPELTVAYANSSGDSLPNDETITHYSQTGIHSNSADIGSASGRSYYGNALAPELSNLRVTSLGVTFPFLASSSISFFVHDYRQVNALTSISNLSFDLPLTGTSRQIGQAVDIDISIWESNAWYSSLTLGFFNAGAAIEKPHPDIFYGLLELSSQF